MKNYIITGFDEKYWMPWGASWILSLREKVNYQGEVFVVDCGLSTETKNKIKEKNISILECKEKVGEIRLRTIETIANFAQDNRGKFVYWDADVQFEEEVDEIFNMIENKFLITSNKNKGFIAAPNYQWFFLKDVKKFMFLEKEKSYEKMFNCLIENFSNMIEFIDDTWNFVDIHKIKNNEGTIEVNNEKKKVIHPTGILKSILNKKNCLFEERFKEELSTYTENKNSTSRRLLIKKPKI